MCTQTLELVQRPAGAKKTGKHCCRAGQQQGRGCRWARALVMKPGDVSAADETVRKAWET